MRLIDAPPSAQDFEDALNDALDGFLVSDSGLPADVLGALEEVAVAAPGPDQDAAEQAARALFESPPRP